MNVHTKRGACALTLLAAALANACAPPAGVGDASVSDAASTQDGTPTSDAGLGLDGPVGDGPVRDVPMLNCGPNGESHGNHCDCNARYYFNGTTCAPVPACSMANDALEPNDTAAQATMIPAGAPYAQASLRVCPGEYDFYAVTLAAGQRLTADVRFAHAGGDIDAYLFAPGVSLERLEDADPVAFSDGVVDNERVTHTAAAPGRYLLLVLGVGVAENAYGLTVSVANP